MNKPELTDTIQDAKDFLKDNWLEGTNCPCCKQRVQLYKLKINAIAVSDLIRLYRLSKGNVGEYKHVSTFSKDRGGAFAKLAHWKLVESQINEDTSKRTSGMWALTYKGLEFVLGDRTVPQRAYLYNKECLGFSEEHVDIHEALGTKFDYSELMGFTQNT